MENKISISKWLPWVASMAFFMQTLDATILNTALPSIAKDLNVPILEMQTVIIAYVITIALLISLSGWLSDKFGSRNIFILAVIIFTLGSLGCGLANSLTTLVLMRVIQAIGGSMMVPVTRLVLLYAYPKSQLLKVTNFITIPGLIGPVIGPSLGGWLVEIATWHWIFFINIPIGIIGALLAIKFVPNYKRTKEKFDFVGFTIFSVGLVLITIGLEIAGTSTKQNNLDTILFIIFLGLLFIALYVKYSKKVKNPLLNLSLLKIRTYKIGVIGNLVTRLGIGGLPLMLPLMLQEGFGVSALTSGSMLIFSAVATIFARSLVVPIIKLLGYKKVLISNTILLGFTILLFMFPNKDTPLLWLVPILILYGAFNSIQMSAMNSVSLADLNEEQASDGNTMIAINQQLSMSFGISFSILILRSLNVISEDLVTAFKYTFFILGLLTIISSFTFSFLTKNDGASMSGKVS